jgi:hypothetical protein
VALPFSMTFCMMKRLTNDTRSGMSPVAAYAAREFRQADKFDALDALPDVRGGGTSPC